MEAPSPTDSPPSRFAVLLYNGFQALDAFGPLDVLNMLSGMRPISLAVLAASDEPVSTTKADSEQRIGERIVPTHTLQNAPSDTEVLLVPGSSALKDASQTQAEVDFIRSQFPKLRFLLTVCTGSVLAARAGVLDERCATSNKAAFKWVQTVGPKVKWVRKARWVTDGNIWTSSGVSAGIDMMFAFVSAQYGEEVAAKLARASEYVRNTDPHHDPFADPEEASGEASEDSKQQQVPLRAWAT